MLICLFFYCLVAVNKYMSLLSVSSLRIVRILFEKRQILLPHFLLLYDSSNVALLPQPRNMAVVASSHP